MNNPSAHDASKGTAQAAKPDGRPNPYRNGSGAPKPRQQDMPKVESSGPESSTPVTDAPTTPVMLQKKKGFTLHAAKGDDDIMSSPPGKTS